MNEYLFIYNANSGIGNALVDYGKKYISPDTYDCELCMVTYGPFGMKRDWKAFVGSLDLPVRFLHKDELLDEFGEVDTTFPALLRNQDGQLINILDSSDFAKVKTLNDLKKITSGCCSSE